MKTVYLGVVTQEALGLNPGNHRAATGFEVRQEALAGLVDDILGG